MSVEEFAARKGLTPRRVRALITSGDLPAARVGSTWVLDDAAHGWSPRTSRPMSPRMAWAFVLALSGAEYPRLAASEIARLDERRARLVASERPTDLVRSWLTHRAQRLTYSISARDLPDLRDDPRLVRSGISDPLSLIGAASMVEGYVARSLLGGLVSEYLLVPSSKADVVLHVYEPFETIDPASDDYATGRLIADLSEHRDARSRSRAEALIRAAS